MKYLSKYNIFSNNHTPQNRPHTNYSRQRSIAIKPRFKSSVKFKKITGCFSDKKQLVDFMIVKELDEETGLYYYGARYLDPRTSRWLTGDPAIYQGDYIPVAPINDDARKHNQNLPGMGGIFNIVNMHAYHYAGNNPVKYVDPDGESDLPVRIIIRIYIEYIKAKNTTRPSARQKFLIKLVETLNITVDNNIPNVTDINERLEEVNDFLSDLPENIAQANERIENFREGLPERIEEFNEGIERLNEGIEQFNERLERFNERLERFNEGLERFNERLERFNERLQRNLE